MARTTSPATLPAALLIFSSLIPFLALAAPHYNLALPKLPARAVQATPPSGGGNYTVDVVATGWYPGWLGDKLPPSQVAWSSYSALTFAFA